MITHNLAVAPYVADVIAVRHWGRLEIGPTDRLVEHPREAYTRALFSPVPRLRPASA
jgi:ABC-type oligopeptide transport system ATPase subunit